MLRSSPHRLARCNVYLLSLLLFLHANRSTTLAQTNGGEFAYFDTPQMQNVSHRQDFCDSYIAIRNGTLELKNSLRGRQLNIVLGAYEGSYFRYSHDEGIDPVYPGIVGVLMDELSRRAGFTWRDSFGIFVDPKGEAYNETWTDLLVWSVDAYDLSVDWWPRNLERLTRGAAFTQEWYDSSIILIGKKQQQQQQLKPKTGRGHRDYWNWLKPFSVEVWLTTAATIVFSGLVFQILEHLNGNRGDRKWFEWWSENLFLSALNATSSYEYGKPKGFPSKVFCISMALWSLILTATYTANLASLLVESNQDESRIVETIQEAIVYGYPICTWESTNSDAFLKDVFPDAIRKPKKTLEEMYDGLHSGECAFGLEVIQSWLINQHVPKFNPKCDLEWVGNGRVVSASAAGFSTITDSGYKCTGLIRDVINIHMEEMISDGFLRDAWEVENSLAKEVDCNTFQPFDVVNSAAGTDDAGRRRRKLEQTRRKIELAKQYNSVGRPLLHDDGRLMDSHRHLKSSAKSAASSMGAIDGGDGVSSQIELDAMLGTFFIHWAFMFIAIAMGFTKKYYREKRKKNIAPRNSSKEQHRAQRIQGQSGGSIQTQTFEESMRIKDELQWQMEDLLHTLKQSKATLIKEQEELQWKIDQLKGMGGEHQSHDDLKSLCDAKERKLTDGLSRLKMWEDVQNLK